MTESPAPDLLELRHASTDRATIVVVPERRLLAIDGVGSPTADDFRFASSILRDVGVALRSRLKVELGIETRVAPLESAWWIHPELPPDEMADAFVDRSKWHWQQMIEVPRLGADVDAEAAVDEVRARAGRGMPLVRLVRFREGRSAQILHVGGTVGEATSVRKLYDGIRQAGLVPRGHLHQIHLADPDRVPPARSRSILRLPVERAA